MPIMTFSLRSAEDALSIVLLGAMALLPIMEIFGRVAAGQGIPGATDYVQHMTLWVGFLGAALAARENRHLMLSFAASFFQGKLRLLAGVLASTVGAAVSFLLAWASAEMVWAERAGSSQLVGGIPVWVAQLVLPAGFALTGLRLLLRAPGDWRGVGTAAIMTLAVGFLGLWPEATRAILLWPVLMMLLLGMALGAPLFSVLGGVALLFFFVADVPIAAIPVEIYRLTSSPILPTVPLFTLAGSILSHGGASVRLVALFRALFGWMPGGTAVVTVGVCTFFTAFTGASGVTILALGGLLLPVLIRESYGERFSIGILTASSSLGVLFPPSLAIILYGVVSHTAIDRLFVAGLLPGLLLAAVAALYGIRTGLTQGVIRSPFSWPEAVSALWVAKWELFVPVLILGSMFSGVATLVEAAALAALYAFLIESYIYKDMRPLREMPQVMGDCAVMVGGILIILSAAMGITNYLVDAEVPARMARWVQASIHSQWLFLLALNGFLIVVGCLMDIFSAIVVVVPLIMPLGEAFRLDPVHLGIIFLANMQLGYLTPPVGMNLFLASYRFEKPMAQVFRAAMPFFLVLLIGVLLVTYLPFMTTGVLELLGMARTV
ncbi:MAG: TRAP transporter large permease subunit [Deltaproteobacteria bacterium]|nr:TRAP transporter large permease subunit [Deltaproteobacteria bacterium]